MDACQEPGFGHWNLEWGNNLFSIEFHGLFQKMTLFCQLHAVILQIIPVSIDLTLPDGLVKTDEGILSDPISSKNQRKYLSLSRRISNIRLCRDEYYSHEKFGQQLLTNYEKLFSGLLSEEFTSWTYTCHTDSLFFWIKNEKNCTYHCQSHSKPW